MNKTVKKLAELRTFNFKPWITTLWLLKRRLVAQEGRYTVVRVDIDKKLQNKLKKAITDRIADKQYKLEEYEFLTADQDHQLFTLDLAETEFTAVLAEIEKGHDNKKVEKYEDLLDCWAYVVQLTHGDKVVYGLRKISTLNQSAKLKGVASALFIDKQLTDLEEDKIFTIDTRIDFFGYDGTAFITNKKEFENALNFRDGMEKNRDAVLDEFLQLKIFNDVEPLKKAIGANLHLLRKISSIQKSKYYKNPQYLADLIKVNNERQWGLVVTAEGAIVVDEGNVDLILTLLNNGRLESPINHELFDTSVKKKVE